MRKTCVKKSCFQRVKFREERKQLPHKCCDRYVFKSINKQKNPQFFQDLRSKSKDCKNLYFKTKSKT